MNIKFPSEVFDWIKQECGSVSPAAFVVRVVEDKRKGSEKGVVNVGNEGCGTSTTNQDK